MAEVDGKTAAIAFLNANFSPWTFTGDEPVTVALTALLMEAKNGRLRWTDDEIARGIVGCQMPPLGCRIENA